MIARNPTVNTIPPMKLKALKPPEPALEGAAVGLFSPVDRSVVKVDLPVITDVEVVKFEIGASVEFEMEDVEVSSIVDLTVVIFVDASLDVVLGFVSFESELTVEGTVVFSVDCSVSLPALIFSIRKKHTNVNKILNFIFDYTVNQL